MEFSDFDWGSLPVLEVDGKQLAQSKAILRYLGKKFNLEGNGEFETAKCDEYLESLADFLAGNPLYSSYVYVLVTIYSVIYAHVKSMGIKYKGEFYLIIQKALQHSKTHKILFYKCYESRLICNEVWLNRVNTELMSNMNSIPDIQHMYLYLM
jgi:hypothetical protein